MLLLPAYSVEIGHATLILGCTHVNTGMHRWPESLENVSVVNSKHQTTTNVGKVINLQPSERNHTVAGETFVYITLWWVQLSSEKYEYKNSKANLL